MKVSIVIPVYNVEKYIDECMNSAINQTLKEIEIIAINDGSTDSSLEKLKYYEQKYDFVKIINQENKGVSRARNLGLEAAKGEFIYFLDSDDYIELDSIEYCYNIAKKNSLDILTFDAKSFEDSEYKGKKLIEDYDRSRKLKSIVMKGEDFYNYAKKYRGYTTPIWLNLYRRSFLIDNKLYFYEGIIHEDELHTFKSILLASAVMYIPKQFFNRRVRSNSIMTSKITYKNAHSMYIVSEEAYKFYNKNINKFDEKTKINIIENIRFFYKSTLMYCDNMDENLNLKDNFRNKIICCLNKNEELLDKKINLQIYNKKLYYIIEDIKLKIKTNIKKLIK